MLAHAYALRDPFAAIFQVQLDDPLSLLGKGLTFPWLPAPEGFVVGEKASEG